MSDLPPEPFDVGLGLGIDTGVSAEKSMAITPSRLDSLANGDDLAPVKWNVTKTKTILRAMSTAAHSTLSDPVFAGADLRMTSSELDSIAGPLTEIINRRPALRRFADASDTVALALGVAGYGGRVLRERTENVLARIEAEQLAAELEGITG